MYYRVFILALLLSVIVFPALAQTNSSIEIMPDPAVMMYESYIVTAEVSTGYSRPEPQSKVGLEERLAQAKTAIRLQSIGKEVKFSRGSLELGEEKLSGQFVYVGDVQNPTAVYFQKEGEESLYKVTPELAEAYYDRKRHIYYQAFELATEDLKGRYFLRCLVEGAVSLYYYQGQEKATYFIKKGEQLLELKEGKAYQVTLLEYMGHSQESLYQIERSRFTATDLINVVRDYNFFLYGSASYTEYKVTKNRQRRLWLSGGSGTEKALLFNAGLGHSQQLGLAYELSFPDVSRSVSFEAGLHLSRVEEQKDAHLLIPQFRSLKGMLGINYHFKMNMVQPFLIGGIAPAMHWYSSSHSEVIKGGIQRESIKKRGVYKNILTAGMGMKFKSSQKEYAQLRWMVTPHGSVLSFGWNMMNK